MYGFIIAFFILAPIILFYASGYRLDLKRYKVLKTGTLFIEAKDIKKADLYLNEEKQEETFTDKKFIYNLLPGEYQVKLSKEGYHDWQKKAVIYSSLTTFIKDAILFKNEIPLQLFDDKIMDISHSPDESKIAYITQGNAFEEIYLYNISNKQKTLIYRLTEIDQPARISWAASSKKILLSFGNNFIIIDAEDPKKITSIKSLLDFTPTQIQWDTQSDNLLYAEFQNAIYKIDLFNKSSVKIFESASAKLDQTFLIEDNDIFYIDQAETQNTLNKYNTNFKTDKKITNIGKSASYKFITGANNYLGLIDVVSQKLYLIKKIHTDLEVTADSELIREFKAKDAVWDAQQKQLLYYDDFEISTFNTEENKEHFINRYGQMIKKISWYPDLEHFVMLLENRLEIIDTTQEVGTRNAIVIVKFDQINNFYLDRKGESIFFNGQIGKQQGLYQLKLK